MPRGAIGWEGGFLLQLGARWLLVGTSFRGGAVGGSGLGGEAGNGFDAFA